MTPVKHFLSLKEDLVCILDESGKILESNSSLKDSFLMGQDFFELIHDEIKEKIFSFFQHQTNNVLRIPECRFLGNEGKSLWLDLKIRRVPSRNSYWCILKDISTRKHYFSVLDQISDCYNLGHWKFESYSNDFTWGLQIYDFFSLSPVSFGPTLEKLQNFFEKEDYNKILNAIFGNNREIDLTLQTNHNYGKWLRLVGKKEFQNDSHFTIEGFIQDVTREHNREAAQLSHNVELSSFEKGLDEFSIVARTDAQGKITYANHEFCRLSKYSEEELLGQDHRIVNSGYHSKEFFKGMWECIRRGKNWKGEIKNKAKDGTYYWVDTIIIPIRDYQGKLVEILSFRFDITRLKQEQEKRELLDKKMSFLQDSLNISFLEYQVNTQKLVCNEEMKSLLGLAGSETVGLERLVETLEGNKRFKFTIVRNSEGIPLSITGVLLPT